MALNVPTYDPNARIATAKPAKGTAWQESKRVRAEHKAHEDREMAKARKRDMAACHGCRWPACEHMPKKPRLEVSHCFEHRGSGGNPSGDRTRRDLLLLACFIHHDLIDAKDAKVEALTHEGTDGPCAFFARDPETGEMQHVASERLIGVSDTRGL